MKIVFYASEKPRERKLAEAFLRGAALFGHETRMIPLGSAIDQTADLSCMVGVKSAALWSQIDSDKLMFDKGYCRSTWPNGYWRLSLNAHHPTETTLHTQRYPSDRFDALGLRVRPWRKTGLQVVFAGSSAKYHAMYGLPDPTTYARRVIKQLRRLTNRPIIYRPKPSWRDAVPVRGSFYSGPKDPLQSALSNAHCVVTHGSNICFEAMMQGIPVITLGDGVSKRITSKSLDDIESPAMGKRDQWLYNLSYHQFTIDEMLNGTCWRTVEGWL